MFWKASPHIYGVHSDTLPSCTETSQLLQLIFFRAFLYAGNIKISIFFAKLLLIIADLLIGVIILSILRTVRPSYGVFVLFVIWPPPGKHLNPDYSDIFYVSLWLFNPFVINVSTRGNNESFVSLLILATAYFVLKDRIFLSSIWYVLHSLSPSSSWSPFTWSFLVSNDGI